MVLRRHWPGMILTVMMALYLAYFAWFTLRAYDAFVYQAHDVGIYDQAVWNTAHGQPFRSTLEEPYDTLLGDHFEPILLLITPIYLLWDSPRVLLLIQTSGLALGALAVYLLARDALGSAQAGECSGRIETPNGIPHPQMHIAPLLFAGIYLLYPPVHAANVFEFHPSVLAIPFSLFAIRCVRKGQTIPFFAFLTLTMSTKEVMPLTTFALGLYVFLIERKRGMGLWAMLASALWFGLAVFVIIPHFSAEAKSQYWTEFYGWLGGSAGEIMKRLLGHPALVWQRLTRTDSLLYVNALLRPTGYVALLGLPVLMGAAPALFLNVLSDWPFQHDPLYYYQYAAGIAPFVIVAAVDGTAFLVRLQKSFHQRIGSARVRKDVAASISIAVVALIVLASLGVQRYHGYFPFSYDYFLPPENQKVAAAHAIVRQVPPEDTVSADLIFGPHLSHRRSIYLFPALHNAKYLIVDASYRDAPFVPRDRYEAIHGMLSSGQYGIVDGQYGYLLLKQGLNQQTVPEQFYDFAIDPDPSPQFRTDISFDDQVRLIGFDLVWERPVRPRANLVLYWQAQRPINGDLRLFFMQTSASGELLAGTELEFDASVWYPPSHWLETETVRTETIHWSIEDPGTFGVAIGVVEGPGFWDIDKRLHPTIRSAPWVLPQLHDGSLVWLATLTSDGRMAKLEPPTAK